MLRTEVWRKEKEEESLDRELDRALEHRLWWYCDDPSLAATS